MPSPQEILADPNFHALPLGDRLKVLRTVDPNFAALPPKEQGTVIYQSASALHPVTDTQPTQPEDQGFLSTLGKDVMAIPGGVIDAVRHPLDTLANATQARLALRPKAAQALKEGNYSGAAGYGLASMMPFLGPMAAQAGEELGGGQPGQGAAHATEVLAPFIKGVRSRLIPSEETIGTAKEYMQPKGWREAKARYQAKKATPTAPQPTAPAASAMPSPSPAPEAPSPAATPAASGVPEGIDPAFWERLSPYSKQSILNRIQAGQTQPAAAPGLTAPKIPPPSSIPAPTPAGGTEIPAAPASTAVSAPPAPTRPLHTTADMIDNFSTRRKVDNLARHFWQNNIPYEELKATYDKAKATGDWGKVRQMELEAYKSGKALEDAGNYKPQELVPKTQYKPPSGSIAAKEAGYNPQDVEGTWDRLLQRYPRTLPKQLMPPAPQPQLTQ